VVAFRLPKIYVLGDDPVFTQTLAEFLRDLGYEAMPLYTVEDLEADAPQTATVVVTLPETLGTDPFGRLRRIHSRLPEVTFLLIVDSDFPTREAVAYGIRNFLRQPLQLTELERAMAG